MNINVGELLSKGMQVAREGRWDEARSIFFDVIAQDPSNYEVWLWLGAIAEDPKDSVAYLGQALLVNPNSIRAQKGMEWAKEKLAQAQALEAAPASASAVTTVEEPKLTEEISSPVIDSTLPTPAAVEDLLPVSAVSPATDQAAEESSPVTPLQVEPSPPAPDVVEISSDEDLSSQGMDSESSIISQLSAPVGSAVALEEKPLPSIGSVSDLQLEEASEPEENPLALPVLDSAPMQSVAEVSTAPVDMQDALVQEPIDDSLIDVDGAPAPSESWEAIVAKLRALDEQLQAEENGIATLAATADSTEATSEDLAPADDLTAPSSQAIADVTEEPSAQSDTVALEAAAVPAIEEDVAPVAIEAELEPAAIEEEPTPTATQEELAPSAAEEEVATSAIEEEPGAPVIEGELASHATAEEPVAPAIEEESAPSAFEEEPAVPAIEEEPVAPVLASSVDEAPASAEQADSQAVESVESEATPVSEPSLEPASTSAEDFVATGKQHLEAGRIDEAIQSFKQALEVNPDEVDAFEQLGVAHYQMDNLDEAIAAFETVVKLKPDQAEAHANLGFLYAEQGKADQAIAAFKEALRFNSGLVEAYLSMADLLKGQGKIDEAIEAWSSAAQIRPDLPDVHVSLGETYAERGQLSEAIWEFRLVVDRKQDDSRAHLRLGQLLLQVGRSLDATREFNEALQYSPDLAEAHYGLASCLEEQKSFEQAIAELERALAIKPDYLEADERLSRLRASLDASQPEKEEEVKVTPEKKSRWSIFRRDKK